MVGLLAVDEKTVIVTIKVTSARWLAAGVNLLRSRPKLKAPFAVWARAFGAVLGLFLSTSTTADVVDAGATPVPAVASQSDPRIARLEKFFKGYHCAAPYHTMEYLRAADLYDLDYRILPAVSIRETSCGKGAKEPNNFWGFHPGEQGFPSIAAGIDFLARRLTQHPFYKGKSLRDKLFTFNPKAAYPDEVQRIMRQIE